MARSDILQLQIPRAINMGNTLVGARQYDLTFYPNRDNYFTGIIIRSIRSIPEYAPIQVYVFRESVELGRYASSSGNLNLDILVDNQTPVLLRVFNLSIDTPVMLTFTIDGIQYNAI